MKIIKSLPWAAGLIAILINCGPTRPKIEIGGYDFKYEGKTYRIESIAPNFMEGYNTLILKEDDRIVLKATDKEQDGILDVVDIGELSLEKAKEIYQEGLDAGERRGYIRKKSIAREYQTTIDRKDYILATYILALGEIYNKLVIRDHFYREFILLDREADGILDEIEKGEEKLGYYQQLYRRVLNNGLREGRIVKPDGKYLVVLN